MVVLSLTWVWLLFYSLWHLTRTSKMDNYVSTELKQPNADLFLEKFEAYNKLKNYLFLSLLLQSITV